MFDEKRLISKKSKKFSPLGLPNPIDISVGKKITIKRSKESVSRPKFAELLGISEALLERMETGKASIPVSVVWYAAALLDTDIKYFFEDILPELTSNMFIISEPQPLFLTDNSKKFDPRAKPHYHKKK